MIKFFLKISFLIILYSSCNLSAGSYPYAERYELDIEYNELINIIKQFKTENPSYCVPIFVHLNDGKTEKNDLWFHIYFYYKDKNQIVYTWIRKSDMNKTTLAFVSINYGLTLGNWQEINKDFNYIENLKQKEIFEDRILNKIREICKKKQSSE